MLLCVACGGPEKPSAAGPNVQSRSVKLRVKAQLDGSQITVQGATDLPDGAVVGCEASYQGAFNNNVIQNYETLIDLGKATVAAETFSLHGNVERLPPGQNKVFCAFMPAIDEQPQQVYDAYGRNGEHLTGSNVNSALETMRSVESEASFAK